jgi:hypothetical protein
MLGTIDLKGRLCDARIAQRYDRLRETGHGLAYILYRALGREGDGQRCGISPGRAGQAYK